MSLVVFEDVSLGFGSKRIVESLDLRLAERDRIGLVGPNGSGKSTLLKMLAGEVQPDGGALRRAGGIRVGYLPQDITLRGGRSLVDFVMESVPGRDELEREIARTQLELDAAASAADADEEAAARTIELAERIAEQHDRLHHFETLYSKHEALRILAGLGFSTRDHERDLAEFSGGWKMRAMLTALLFQRPDLLLLDEPTNHLDLPSVAWLAEFLGAYPRAFVLICHDREFLNEQVGRIVSFEVEGVRQYRGDYEAYRRQRAEEEEILAARARNLARERDKAEQFISRFRAQANKARAVQSRIKSLEKMETVHDFSPRKIMRFRFPPCARSGAQAMRITGLAKSFGSLRVLDGVELRVPRGEKIGIIGVNGAGKTTLLRMMAGELPPDAGEIRLGHGTTRGYYAQHHADVLEGSQTVLESVGEVDRSASPTRVRTICGAFLFQGDEVDKPVRVLSGGERARVALARLMLAPGNLLLMDEPTNHLDLESSESLAESLAEYDGTLVFVSHNRSFIRRLATQIWNVEDGRVEVYPGTLEEYLDAQRRRASGDAEARPTTRQEKSSAGEDRGGPSPSGGGTKSSGPDAADKGRARRKAAAQERRVRTKRLGPLEKEVSTLEARISSLEGEQAARSRALADPEIYEDHAQRSQLLEAYASCEETLEELGARWEVAAAELEAARAELSS